jgi:hypothetical protein
VLPITDQEITFAVVGSGKLIGVGNGDPTSHESDIGSARKAFSGLCMGIVQAGKTAGNITVEATSPGLAAASAAVAVKPSALRPQVAEWERKVPAGSTTACAGGRYTLHAGAKRQCADRNIGGAGGRLWPRPGRWSRAD